ncbi:hypothetical protein EON65_41860 [archaeon]|nr:MAG: hypothetical protein EON65_41860 [archaeon]
MSEKGTLAAQGETIESLMAKGMSRVQAIRKLYEKIGSDSAEPKKSTPTPTAFHAPTTTTVETADHKVSKLYIPIILYIDVLI